MGQHAGAQEGAWHMKKQTPENEGAGRE